MATRNVWSSCSGKPLLCGESQNARSPASPDTERKETCMSASMAPPERAAASSAIRPFRVEVPEEALVDLRQRVAAMRWPDKETVADASQGVQLATMQALARRWATDYDWRQVESRLNALPQFLTEIDG